jgi:TonB-linked SusC/RagA family outer membrane protein
MRNRLRNGIYSITNPFIMTRFLHTVVNPFRRIPPGVIAALWCCFLIGQTIPALAQERTVQGRVLSEDRVGFPGVNIIVKGTAQGTVTDADGNYSIAVSSVNDVLVFSSIGYETVEVVVGNRSTIDVDMVVDVKQLDEVVVVGYGTVKKSDVTGSLVSVTSDVIKERPVQNVLQALQGRAAGMHVTSNFKPGELPVVRIRGNRSLNASNDPLYVVDGIPLISGNISDINPNDIASIEVLKDASATAIYGSRGANGVVLITTNKGAKGKVSVNVNSTYSLDSYHSLTDWMNGGQYIDRWRESLMNGGLYSTAQFTDLNTPVIRGYPDPDEDISRMQLSQDPVAMESVLMGYEWEDFIGGTVRMRNTTAEEQAMGWPAQVPVYNSANIRSFDWIDQVTRQGITQSHQISLTSGTESSRLYLSLGYYDQLGVQRDQDYERFNTTVSGDITANNWLTLGASLIGSFSLQNFGFMGPNTSNTGSKDLYSRATEQFPYALPRDADGRWIRNAGGNLSLWNPIIDIDQTKNERRATSLMASLYAEIKFTPWLKYRMNFGPQFRHFRNGSWTGPDATSHLTNRPNTAGYTRTEDFSWVLENLLYADKTFGDHTIGVTLLQSSQESRQERIATSVTSTIYDISYWYDLAANLNGVPGSYGTGFTSNTLMSWMGRINYSFRDKYLLTASGRFDGASVLAEGHKWHFFPSLAVAWKLHEEEFMSFANAISELKPRFGFGVTGNSSVSPYTTTGPLSRNPYVFGSTPAIGYLPQLVRNPELEWEKTSQWNIGLDFGLFQNRLRGSLEIYDAKTNDLIMRKTLPAVSGYVEKLENVGKTRNRGIEITLSSVNIEKGDFTWTMDVNWSRNKEEIVELLSGKEDMLAQRWFIGQPLQVYYQYENAGIWQNTAEDLEEMAKFNAKGHRFHPGTIKVVDQNGDYVITADDMVIRGSDRPKWTGGITNTFRYKNWTLSSFIYARVGQTYFGGYPNSYGGVWPNGRVENDVWSWDNPGGKWPMPNFGNVENITAAMQYHDGSFYAVRNIAVSFDFPGSMIDRFKINSLQLSAQVVNPFIFGGDMVRMGINPDDETNWQIASSNTNPLGGMNNNTILPQSFVFGLRASF